MTTSIENENFIQAHAELEPLPVDHEKKLKIVAHRLGWNVAFEDSLQRGTPDVDNPFCISYFRFLEKRGMIEIGKVLNERYPFEFKSCYWDKNPLMRIEYGNYLKQYLEAEEYFENLSGSQSTETNLNDDQERKLNEKIKELNQNNLSHQATADEVNKLGFTNKDGNKYTRSMIRGICKKLGLRTVGKPGRKY